MNADLAGRVIEKLLTLGVRETCLCAGARNSPLIVALQQCRQMQVWHFFEERSAAFFALGRSWSRGREPIAIVTTSGTAAGELLPAIMEAYYAGIPLIALTADRPRSFRGTGAPQSAEHLGIYSHYVKRSFDVASIDESNSIELRLCAPIHINVCFPEPLLDTPIKQDIVATGTPAYKNEPSDPAALKRALAGVKRPLVILSPYLRPHPVISELIEQCDCLIYAEAASQNRRAFRNVLRAGANKVSALVSEGAIDGVIRLGAVPTLRFWRDLEDRFIDLPVVSLSSPPFSGLARRSAVFSYTDTHLKTLVTHLGTCDGSAMKRALQADQRIFERLDQLLRNYPRSEPGWMRWLSDNIPSQSRIFLGNSLPIRQWDLAATYEEKQFKFHCSRGLNGIDGQVSTFLGWAAELHPNFGIFGDLTTMYDLSAPWILRQTSDLEIKIIVINNQGGQIFDRMFGNPWFINSHDMNFEPWADLWNLEYVQNEAMLSATARQVIVEIKPDPESTRAFWREYEQ